MTLFRKIFGPVAVGSFLLGSVFFGVGVARADVPADYDRLFGQSICNLLDANTTLDQLAVIVRKMMADGLTSQQAAASLNLTLHTRCPWQIANVEMWADQARRAGTFEA